MMNEVKPELFLKEIPWMDYLYNIGEMVFWFIINKEYFAFLKVKRNLRTACDNFQYALHQNTVKQSELMIQIDEMKLRYGSITSYIQAQMGNHHGRLLLQTQQRGEPPPVFTADDVYHWLSFEDQKIAESGVLLKVRIDAMYKHVNALRGVHRTLLESFGKCVNHYTSIDLSNHVNDITKFISDVQVTGVEAISVQLNQNVEKFLESTSEVNRAIDEETQCINKTLESVNTNPKDKFRSNFFNEILKKIATTVKVNNSLKQAV